MYKPTQESDIISLHLPLLPETYHIINKESLVKMKKGVVIINVSRGALVDTIAVEGQVWASYLTNGLHNDDVVSTLTLTLTLPHCLGHNNGSNFLEFLVNLESYNPNTDPNPNPNPNPNPSSCRWP